VADKTAVCEGLIYGVTYFVTSLDPICRVVIKGPGYGLDGPGFTTLSGPISFHQHVQISSGATWPPTQRVVGFICGSEVAKA